MKRTGFLEHGKRTSAGAGPDVEGVVLSGGGAKASFQLGALTYLYDRAGIAPRVLVGTSGGSILAAFLAQRGDRDGQREVLEQLNTWWLGMTEQSDMFAENAWFTRLRSRGPEWQRLVSSTQSLRVARPSALSRALALWKPRKLQEAELDEDDGTVPAWGLDVTDDAAWTPTFVMQLVNAIPAISRSSGDLPTILRGLERTRSMYRPGTVVKYLVDPTTFDPDRVAASGMTLRLATVALESGELRFVTEDGLVVNRDDVPLPGAEVSLVNAVLASCALPGIFQPVKVADEHCVDGSTRESLAVEMAVRHLGVTKGYAICAGAPGVQPELDYAARDLISVMTRAASIMTDEVLRDEVHYAHSVGAVVIQPELEVHDLLTVEPGLIALNHDYGWIRAAEAVLGATREQEIIHRCIVSARRDAWELERELASPETDEQHRPALLAALKHSKTQVRELVAQSHPGMLPDGAEAWWLRYEKHRIQPDGPPPWLAIAP